MNGLLGLAACCMILAGLLQICSREMAWKMTEWNNSLRGVQSEETTAWRAMSIVQGAFAMGAGVLILAMLLSSASTPSASATSETIEGPIIHTPAR